MFKQMAFSVALVIITTNLFAQAFEGKVKNGKTEEPAIGMVYHYPYTIVENAFKAKFTDKQLKAGENKLFTFFPNALLEEISKSKLDYYFKLEPTTKEKTTVYLVMEGAGDIEGSEHLGERAKSFLENMGNEVKRSEAIVEIKKQEASLVNEEEALLKLQKEQNDLEEKLQANKAKQLAQQKIVDSQKVIIDDLKSKL